MDTFLFLLFLNTKVIRIYLTMYQLLYLKIRCNVHIISRIGTYLCIAVCVPGC